MTIDRIPMIEKMKDLRLSLQQMQSSSEEINAEIFECAAEMANQIGNGIFFIPKNYDKSKPYRSRMPQIDVPLKKKRSMLEGRFSKVESFSKLIDGAIYLLREDYDDGSDWLFSAFDLGLNEYNERFYFVFYGKLKELSLFPFRNIVWSYSGYRGFRDNGYQDLSSIITSWFGKVNEIEILNEQFTADKTLNFSRGGFL